MRVGLYGGSFDPIHRGHVQPIQEAKQQLELDQVIYLPTAQPPHKPHRRMAPALARLVMVELALLREEGLVVSPFELGPEASYTVHTLEHFQEQWPERQLVLLIGSDSFLQLHTWRAAQRLVELAELGVLLRPGSEVRPEELAPELAALLHRGRARLVRNQPVGLSSTELRRRLQAGEQPGEHELCPLVLDYVEKYGLYRHRF